MKTVRFERQSGGIEEYECVEFDLDDGGLKLFKRTKGVHNFGTPLYYTFLAIPACDVRYVEEVIPEDDRG